MTTAPLNLATITSVYICTSMCVCLWTHTIMTWVYYLYFTEEKMRHTETK